VIEISYGIIRIAKYKKDDVPGIESHDKRKSEKGNSNKDINWSLSQTNYDLHISDSHDTFTKKINKRIQELNLSKAPRKDAVVMAQVLITSDYKFFENISKDKQEKFFKDSYDFICERYGKENIVSAIVHLDEATPHMHINFVPVTSEGRLSAKTLFDRSTNSLRKLQTDFYEDVAKDYELERGVEGSKQKHKKLADYKLETALKKVAELNTKAEKINREIDAKINEADVQLANMRSEINRETKKWEDKKSRLKNEYAEASDRYKKERETEERKLSEIKKISKTMLAENKKSVSDINRVRKIQPKKNMMGIQDITIEDINWLKEVAESYYFSQITIREKNLKIYELEETLEEASDALARAVDELTEYDGYKNEFSRLQKIEKAFRRLPKVQQEALLAPPVVQQQKAALNMNVEPKQKTVQVQKKTSKIRGYDR
jgi:hypothetical protein